uniref:Uncharacterized protein n=2 Tax=Alexandrium monilatum TaxID=311494 RepID=A0A7S4W7B3_9DINO
MAPAALGRWPARDRGLAACHGEATLPLQAAQAPWHAVRQAPPRPAAYPPAPKAGLAPPPPRPAPPCPDGGGGSSGGSAAAAVALPADAPNVSRPTRYPPAFTPKQGLAASSSCPTLPPASPGVGLDDTRPVLLDRSCSLGKLSHGKQSPLASLPPPPPPAQQAPLLR